MKFTLDDFMKFTLAQRRHIAVPDFIRTQQSIWQLTLVHRRTDGWMDEVAGKHFIFSRFSKFCERRL